MLRKKVFSRLAKRTGSASLLAVILVVSLITTILGLGAAKLVSSMYAGQVASYINEQAQEYAASTAEVLRNASYDTLTDVTREKLTSSDFSRTITVKENAPAGGLTHKEVNIQIFYQSESQPRTTLQLKRLKFKPGSLPIGSIIALPFGHNAAHMPALEGVWLPCDYSPIPAQYTELRKVMKINFTPDLRAAFLRGIGRYDSDHVSGSILEIRQDSEQSIKGWFRVFVPQYIAWDGLGLSNAERRHGRRGYGPSFNTANPDIMPYGSFGFGKTERLQTDLADGANEENATYQIEIKFDNRNFVKTDSAVNEVRPENYAVYYCIKAK